MPRSESRTKTAIWSDEDFRKLTLRAQRMYWMLYSQSTISLCGVLALTERRWASVAVDETLEGVRDALAELEDHRFIAVDYDTEEVFVRSFARHDGVARSPKTFPVAWKQLDQIASPRLRQAAEAELQALSDTPLDSQPDTESHTPFTPSVDTPCDTPPDTPRGRGRAVSVLRPLSPVSKSQSPSGADTPSKADLVQSTGTGQDLALAKRLAALCTADNRQMVNTEAASVICWASRHLDSKVIEGALGWAEASAERPVFPRAVASVIQAKASDHGIPLTAFSPNVSYA